MERKTAKEVLYYVNDFISLNSIPKIIQADNGWEFSNHLIDDFCQRKGIQLIYSNPLHPSTNGVVERVHQNIRIALLAIKIKQKNNYDIRNALTKAENAQNNVIHTIMKYKPKEIFNNNNIVKQNAIIKENIIKSQKNTNKNVEKLPVNTYVIISNVYLKVGTKLKIKYNSKGIRNILGIIIGNDGTSTYKVKILISYKALKLNNIYDIEYQLIKKCSQDTCDFLIKEYLENKNKVKSKYDLENSKNNNEL